MPFQNLPPELVVAIFGSCDSFRTATALSATSRYFHSIWTHHTKAILGNVSRIVLPYPQEANLLADRYEEIYALESTGDGAADAVRRVSLLLDELRMMRELVEHAMRMLQGRKYYGHELPLPPASEQRESLLQQAYRATIFTVSMTWDDFGTGPIWVLRSAFQRMQMVDLLRLRLSLPTLGGFTFYCSLYVLESVPCVLRDSLRDHFGPCWRTGKNGDPRCAFPRLDAFLHVLIWRLTIDPPLGAYKHFVLFGEDVGEQMEQRGNSFKLREVGDVMASNSSCRNEGDHWKIDLTSALRYPRVVDG